MSRLSDDEGLSDLPAAPDQDLDPALFDDGADFDIETECGPDINHSNDGQTAAKDSQ